MQHRIYNKKVKTSKMNNDKNKARQHNDLDNTVHTVMSTRSEAGLVRTLM